MPRFKKPLYSLKRPKYRPSWNKYNLYNMDRVKDPVRSPTMTYFQQKWQAKAATRTYHGTTMRETDWRRIFRPDMRSVVSMDAQYLGEHDGSNQSAGRGSGRNTEQRRPRSVPYMNMIYHQLERRLDVAIWRALFASSVSQARQFVVHGGVHVNGRKMIYPGYLLNPGDMFQVEVEKVMFATGDRKDYWERRFGRQDRRRGHGKARRGRLSTEETEEVDAVEEAVDEPAATEAEEAKNDGTPSLNQSKTKLQDLMTQARAVLNHPKTRDETAARKQSLRAFAKLVRKELGQKASWNTPIKEQITALAENLDLTAEEPVQQQTGTAESTSVPKAEKAMPLTQTLQADEERLLSAALQQYKENPVDYTKGYKTPWQFRPYASPFIFVPRYLEVHAPICAAVYLRHPVARSGLGEVPTPYPELVNGLAFNWYLRRR